MVLMVSQGGGGQLSFLCVLAALHRLCVCLRGADSRGGQFARLMGLAGSAVLSQASS